MKTRAWLTAALCGLVAAPAVVPAQTPAPQEVVLKFKHQAGKTRKFRLGMKSDMTMTPISEAGDVGSLPMLLKSTAFFTEKVQKVEDGTAALLVSPLSLTMDTSAFGMSIVLKMEGGKLTMNGQEVTADSPLGPVAQMLSDEPIQVRRSPLGTLEMLSPPNGISQMLSSSLMVQLPEGAVKPGDSWDTSAVGATQLPLGGGVPSLELKLTHTLKALEKAGGRTLALIDTVGGADLGGQGSQKFSGSTRFDVTEGSIKSGSYKADVKMKVKMPAGLGGAPGGAPEGGNDAGSMQIEGQVIMNLAEVLPAPVKKPAARPAPRKASKKPVRRKR